MTIIKLWDIAIELQKSGISSGSYKGVIEYGLAKGKGVVIFNDAIPEEDLKTRDPNNVQFFVKSFWMARKIKKILEKSGFPVKTDIFSSMRDGLQGIIVLNVTGNSEELQDALLASKDSDSIIIGEAIS